ncbi:MAG TPA: response regulator [Pseudomonadota bacterium]|nr:response regulator [Pseudomonadota bacterium]
MLILVVEDEPIARMAYLSLLSKIRGVSVIAASNVAEARAMIHEQPPKVVILDLQLPDGTGLDVAATLEAFGSHAVLIVVSAHLDDFRPAIYPNERIHLLSKPVPLRELLQIVEQVALSADSVPPFSVADYVQLACMGQHSVTIESSTSGSHGYITIEKGQPWFAQDEQGVGVPAFNRLVLATGRQVRVLTDKRRLGPRNLTERWELLLLDAMRLGDEAKHQKKDVSATKFQATQNTAPARPAVASPAPSAAAIPARAAVASSTVSMGQAAAPSKSSLGAGRAGSQPVVVSAPPASVPIVESPQVARNTAAASATVEDPAASSSGEFDACTERALRAVVNHDFERAIEEFERALRMRPDDRMIKHRLEKLNKLRDQQGRRS